MTWGIRTIPRSNRFHFRLSGPEERKRLLSAILLTGGVMIVEVIGGLMTNSLALLSDAGHMLTHLLALSISFVAMIFSVRPPPPRRRLAFTALKS
ncbi:MAG: cation transporter [Candidatus Manganitrophus sp.]|nr:cation transporter [Candidatus Manganitrophus sp.]